MGGSGGGGGGAVPIGRIRQSSNPSPSPSLSVPKPLPRRRRWHRRSHGWIRWRQQRCRLRWADPVVPYPILIPSAPKLLLWQRQLHRCSRGRIKRSSTPSPASPSAPSFSCGGSGGGGDDDIGGSSKRIGLYCCYVVLLFVLMLLCSCDNN